MREGKYKGVKGAEEVGGGCWEAVEESGREGGEEPVPGWEVSGVLTGVGGRERGEGYVERRRDAGIAFWTGHFFCW